MTSFPDLSGPAQRHRQERTNLQGWYAQQLLFPTLVCTPLFIIIITASLLAGIGNYSVAVPVDDAMKNVSVSALKANATLLQKTIDQYIYKLPALEDVPDVVLNSSMAIGQTLEPYMQVVCVHTLRIALCPARVCLVGGA